MNDVDEQLRRALAHRAQQVHDPDPEARAAEVIRRARRDGRRRAVGTGTVAALLAVAGGTAWLTGGQGDDTETRPTPDVRGQLSQSPTPLPDPPTPTSTASRAGQLPVGAPVGAVPRTELRAGRWTVVTGQGPVELPTGAGAPFALAEVGDQTLLLAHAADFLGGETDLAARLLRVGPDGAVAELARGDLGGLVASPDGTRVATLIRSRTTSTVVVRDDSGAVERTIGLDRPDWRLAGQVVDLVAWSREGLVVTGTSPDAGSTAGPVTLAIDPDGTSAQPVRRLSSVVQLGAGQVVVLQRQQGRDCFGIGPSVNDARQVACARGQLVLTGSLAGAVQVRPLDASGTTPAGATVWLVDPDGTVHPGTTPGGDLVSGPMLWEAPGVALHHWQGPDGQPSWVRWAPATARLEQAPEPEGRGTVQP